MNKLRPFDKKSLIPLNSVKLLLSMPSQFRQLVVRWSGRNQREMSDWLCWRC